LNWSHFFLLLALEEHRRKLTPVSPARTMHRSTLVKSDETGQPGMAEKIFNLCEAKARLSQLVERAAAGETVVIGKAGRAMARLVPMSGSRKVRLGSLRGRIHVPEDFDRLVSGEIQAMFSIPT